MEYEGIIIAFKNIMQLFLAFSFVLTTSFIFYFLMQYDFELVFVKNNHEFVDEYMKKPEFIELMRRLGALGDGNQDQSKF